MAVIPNPPTAGPLVSFDILAAAAPISPEVQVQAIDIWTTAGKAPRARITIRSGEPQGAATTVNEHAFLPGTRIELRIGYDNQNSPLFDGEVVAQNLEVRETQGGGWPTHSGWPIHALALGA